MKPSNLPWFSFAPLPGQPSSSPRVLRPASPAHGPCLSCPTNGPSTPRRPTRRLAVLRHSTCPSACSAPMIEAPAPLKLAPRALPPSPQHFASRKVASAHEGAIPYTLVNRCSLLERRKPHLALPRPLRHHVPRLPAAVPFPACPATSCRGRLHLRMKGRYHTLSYTDAACPRSVSPT